MSLMPYRQISPVKGMDDKGLVAEVDDAGDPIAGLEGRHGAGDELTALPVLHHTVVVAVLHILHKQISRIQTKQQGKGTEYFF
jgi:hypothetical protein